MKKQDYKSGQQAVAVRVARTLKPYLPASDVAWDTERVEALPVLRKICEQWGDNDWPDNLHLADVLEKHLMRYLESDAG